MGGLFLFALIFVPLVELWLLILVGQEIGALVTIAIVVITAVIGSQLVRRQGTGVMRQIQSAQARGEVPAVPIIHGATLLMAGFMLLVPGFLTDACGFLLLIPRLRERLARWLLSRVTIMTPFGRRRPHGHEDKDDDAIEGDYERRKDKARENLKNSRKDD